MRNIFDKRVGIWTSCNIQAKPKYSWPEDEKSIWKCSVLGKYVLAESTGDLFHNVF